jgi:hypothetical protein
MKVIEEENQILKEKNLVQYFIKMLKLSYINQHTHTLTVILETKEFYNNISVTNKL